MVAANETRDRSINIRVSSRIIDLIDRAASLQHKSRSDFMVEAAARTAEDVLLDGNVFTLAGEEWDEYVATIANPPEPTENLRAFLREPAPWD